MLSYGQIQNLYNVMPRFSCKVCGDEQKIGCDKSDECLLIKWITDQEEELTKQAYREMKLV